VTGCNICGAERSPGCETARVRCNVRRFREERFDVWRCGSCASIHASEAVDLDRYYRGYPVFGARLDWKLNAVYGNLLRRLRRAGVKPEHRILDYGCGGGLLVRYLRQQGYAGATGFDPYHEAYSDRSVLDERYDCIVSQDVIEHVEDPRALLGRFGRLVKPGGVVSIGTPDAAALDLREPEGYVHALHQPFHRHMFSARALREAGQAVGWSVERLYSTMYNNTLFPFMNPRFVLHYLRCLDDVWDLVAEPIRFNSYKLWTPVTLFFALFGYFFDRHTDIMVVFRAPRASGEEAPNPIEKDH
jgi:SAM-dependent methyltransferase